MRSYIAASAALSLVSYVAADCESFGIDFQNGGSYFQNSLSNEDFTALQEFEGCQDDVSNNIFVDPNGDQSECTQTSLTPDDTPQLVNCTQWPKSSLYSGDWSLVVISNNGNADPIAYQRDFSLSVGPQQTITTTSTATITNQMTPIVNRTSTSTYVYTTTVPSSTTTVMNPVSATTVTPRPSITATTQGLITLTHYFQTLEVDRTTATVPASCVTQGPSRVQDPIAKIQPTILGELDNVVTNIIENAEDTVQCVVCGLLGRLLGTCKREVPVSAKFRRAIVEGRTPSEELKRAFVKERHERLAKQLHKRAPDEPTITVTADDVITSTVVQSAATKTNTITSVVLRTSTVRSGVATVNKTGGVQTITASASTKTLTFNVPIAVATVTRTKDVTITNTVTTTSAGAAQSCASRGGTLQ